jgi:hypothetical protein
MSGLLEKLERELKLPIESERQVTHVLMLTRKIMDAGGPPFNHLRMMCNWAFHTELSNTFVRSQIEFLDGISPMALSGMPSNIQTQFSEVFSLTGCREDLMRFIRHHRLNQSLRHVFKPDWWASFLSKYIPVVSESPLLLSGNTPKVKNIDSIHLSGHGTSESTDPRFSKILNVYWTIKYLDTTTLVIPVPLGIEKDDGFVFGRARFQGGPQQPPPRV